MTLNEICYLLCKELRNISLRKTKRYDKETTLIYQHPLWKQPRRIGNIQYKDDNLVFWDEHDICRNDNIIPLKTMPSEYLITPEFIEHLILTIKKMDGNKDENIF